MWRALKSDLTEFVAAVAEDTSQVLSKIDDAGVGFPVPGTGGGPPVSEEEEEAFRRMRLEETYTAPLILANLGGEEGITDPELQAYMESFEEVTTDLEREWLQTYPEVQEMHQKLVLGGAPASTEEANANDDASGGSKPAAGPVDRRDFWMRYHYRCDPDRIAAEWSAQDDLAADDEDEDGGKVGGPDPNAATGTASWSRFLGGAVQSVAASLRESDGIVGEGGDSTAILLADTAAGPGSIFGGLGVGGRPPFVLNTAVDDDEAEEAEEEEEEELGWDDDDDDEDDDDEKAEEDDSRNQTGEIEFRDAATEQLQDKLKQALEERDQLHETVALQSKEIASLLAEATTSRNSVGVSNAANEETEALRLQLFEAQAELAAVKTRLAASAPSLDGATAESPNANDKGDDDAAALLRQVEDLQGQIQRSDIAAAALRSQLDQLQATYDALVLDKQESLQAAAMAKEQELAARDAQARERAQRSETDLQERQYRLELAEKRIAELEQELAVAVATATAAAVTASVASSRPTTDADNEDMPASGAASPDTHQSSTSSGVRVEAPLSSTASPQRPTPPPVVERVDEGGAEDGSDWGDDW